MRASIGVGLISLLLAVALAAGPAWAGEHPGSGADCRRCHTAGRGTAEAPKVVPEPPGFWARLFGAKPIEGHPSVSCAGVVREDGTVTGCHRPEGGGEAFLVAGGQGRPVDELCGACHAEQREPGKHHPTYKKDTDADGVPDKIVRPAGGQEVYGPYAPSPEGPVDTLEFRTLPDGTRELVVRLPLETVTETVDGAEVVEPGVVTCTTCHNPHYGYLAGVGSEEDLNTDLVARESGDALLRLRDFDNALCEACH
ncbi:cytochrome c3 family protein [Deferrisoma palaeochoriense]